MSRDPGPYVLDTKPDLVYISDTDLSPAISRGLIVDMERGCVLVRVNLWGENVGKVEVATDAPMDNEGKEMVAKILRAALRAVE